MGLRAARPRTLIVGLWVVVLAATSQAGGATEAVGSDPYLAWATRIDRNGPSSHSHVAVDALGNILITGSTETGDARNSASSRSYSASHGSSGQFDLFSGRPILRRVPQRYSAHWGYGPCRHVGSESVAAVLDPDWLYGDNWDAFVSKFSASGELLWSADLGGSSLDEGYGVTVDRDGAVYVGGWTKSTDFPATAGLDTTLEARGTGLWQN